MSNEIHLAGCSPRPLASYLKALGILRLVAEQVDAQAKAFWRDDQFVLITRLDRRQLQHFFLDDYQPTPILAPWNGGSGFYPKDNQSGIQPISDGKADRFTALREAIQVMRSILDRMDLDAKPSGEFKEALLRHLRGELDDSALRWIDAAVLMTDDSPKYPPLLGTGGNDGRLDFTNNFMQRLVLLLDPKTGNYLSPADEYLREALFARSAPNLASAAIGQFSPGDAGGPNATSGFDAKALINPWDFILMLEGAVLFAAAATRRLESSAPGALSYPFTVRATGAGSGIAALADEGSARAEIWLPLWSAPATIRELRVLLAEGRVTLGRRPARDGLDFVRAVSKLGAERGIEAFQRYGFMMRSGKAYLATPLNRIRVERNPAADLIDDLEQGGWLSRFRKLGRNDNLPSRIHSLVRQLEDAVFDLCSATEDAAPSAQRVLGVLGEIQLYLASSPGARELCRPVPWLSSRWVLSADDGTAEFAVAVALAGLHGQRQSREGRMHVVLPMRSHLAPERSGRPRRVGSPAILPNWLEENSHQVTWRLGSLSGSLSATTQRRLLEIEKMGLADKPWYAPRTAPLWAVADWLMGSVDEHRVARLLPGLMLAMIPSTGVRRTDNRVGSERAPLPAAYRLIKPFFCTDSQLRDAGLLTDKESLSVPGRMLRQLMVGDVIGAAALAERHLRIKNIAVSFDQLAANVADHRRLLGALIVPIRTADLRMLLSVPANENVENESTS